MRHTTIFTQVVMLSFLVVGLAGCFSSNPKDIQAYVKPTQVVVTAENYILQPPDEIEIHCLKVPEINLQRQRIRPDGKVSFEGLGELAVAGKTIGEASNMIKQSAAKLYTLVGDNPIDVRVAVFRSQIYYVLGQVTYPGPKAYTGRDTVFSALATAGPTVLAWEGRIQVIRPSEDETLKPKIFEVDFDRMSAYGDLSKDVLLQEGDVIFVPPTVLAAIALKIEEFTRPILRALAPVYAVQSVGGGGGGVGGGGL